MEVSLWHIAAKGCIAPVSENADQGKLTIGQRAECLVTVHRWFHGHLRLWSPKYCGIFAQSKNRELAIEGD
jgi:hypothetical protein